MAARKKKIKPENDEVLIALKERYFKIIKREKVGITKQITKTLDDLEIAINNRMEEIK